MQTAFVEDFLLALLVDTTENQGEAATDVLKAMALPLAHKLTDLAEQAEQARPMHPAVEATLSELTEILLFTGAILHPLPVPDVAISDIVESRAYHRGQKHYRINSAEEENGNGNRK